MTIEAMREQREACWQEAARLRLAGDSAGDEAACAEAREWSRKIQEALLTERLSNALMPREHCDV